MADRWDNHVGGRDPSRNKDDRESRMYKMYEGDIFLKHNEDPDAAAIKIKENSIGLHVKGGNVGIKINDTGNILVQSKVILKASGRNVVKGDYTENSLSFINMTDLGGYPPHVHTLKPAYLFRMPDVGMVMNILGKFSAFTKLF